MADLTVNAAFPRKFKPLLETRARYKCYYGGRGGAKSWQFARALLIEGIKTPGLRILCTREVQSSLQESVKQLLADQIELLGLTPFYQVLKNEVRGPGGTLFMFKGLSDPEALKSAESIDRVWIEEARVVTKTSWSKLDFTIRKPGAEVWVSFNPELETDYLYELFIKNPPPPSSLVVKVGCEDNPWISGDFMRQAEHLKRTDYDEWLWAIGGHCRVALEGAVYANQLREVQREGRITRVPLERAKPVHMFLDLGRGDMTAIWFAQIVGFEYRLPFYYQNSGEDFGHYLGKLEDLRQERGWFYGTMWLPHDAKHKTLAARRTIEEQARDAGYRVRIAPSISVADGINAARTIFPMCWFDEAGAKDGLNCLRQYHYEVDEDGTRTRLPVHDWSSHGADAFRYMGVALREEAPKAIIKPKSKLAAPKGRQSWMTR